MNLSTIDMPRAEARKKFLEYRRAVRDRHDAEDEQIMRGYRELARGMSLIRLSEAVLAGGTTEVRWQRRTWDGRRLPEEVRLVPRIAVCRAHQEKCWTGGIGDSGEVVLQGKREVSTLNRRDVLRFSGFPEAAEGEHRKTDIMGATWSNPDVRAIVPPVPPPLRPKAALHNYHVLFEAEWGVDPQPPIDPALLKRVGGDLYAVVAVWDLTEVERAVLAGRDA